MAAVWQNHIGKNIKITFKLRPSIHNRSPITCCLASSEGPKGQPACYWATTIASPTSYNNRNPALGVLWSWHRVASPPIEIPIQIWKKKFADKLHKSYKKHPWQTSPTFSGHFTLQAEPKINWNNYISMVLWACFSNKVCIYQKTNL